jgi:hypothetical protein
MTLQDGPRPVDVLQERAVADPVLGKISLAEDGADIRTIG